MPKFVVTHQVEYSVVVDAKDADEATEIAFSIGTSHPAQCESVDLLSVERISASEIEADRKKKAMTMQAGAVQWPREATWRGVVDDVEPKSGVLGAYQSGTRRSRCQHHHRTEATAMACAERQLSAVVKEMTL